MNTKKKINNKADIYTYVNPIANIGRAGRKPSACRWRFSVTIFGDESWKDSPSLVRSLTSCLCAGLSMSNGCILIDWEFDRHPQMLLLPRFSGTFMKFEPGYLGSLFKQNLSLFGSSHGSDPTTWPTLVKSYVVTSCNHMEENIIISVFRSFHVVSNLVLDMIICHCSVDVCRGYM